MLAMVALLAVPLSHTAVSGTFPMGHSMVAAESLSADSNMNCKACDQLPVGSTVCPASYCAILGILAHMAVAVDINRSSFSIVQAVAPQQHKLTPPTPPA